MRKGGRGQALRGWQAPRRGLGELHTGLGARRARSKLGPTWQFARKHCWSAQQGSTDFLEGTREAHAGRGACR